MSQTPEKDPPTPSAAPAGELPRPAFRPGTSRETDPGSIDVDDGPKVGRGIGEEASA